MLRILTAASWPRDDADAAARLGWQRARLAAVGGAARWAYRTVAEAVRDAVQGPMTKAGLSAAVTARIPSELSPYCRPCRTHHVGEQLLRLAALPGGLRLRPDSTPALFEPIPGHPGPPADTDAGSGPLQAEYLRFFAPATDADIAAFLGTTTTATRPHRPERLVAARVAGRVRLLPEDQLDALRAAAPAEIVRLLPPSDPLLQGRDRDLLVPDPAHRKVLWRALGAPGAVLSGNGNGIDVVGAWRPRTRGRVLQLTIEAFRPPTAAQRTAVEEEAQRLVTVRGAREAVVEWSRGA
jgi:hypothetical protein